MKYVEIILKIIFLIAAGCLLFVQPVQACSIISFAVVSVLLGLTLIFNKNQSYGYKLSKREVKIREAEGILLIAFALVMIFGSHFNF